MQSDPASSEFIVFGAPAIEEAEIEEVTAVLRSGWLGTGPKTAQFEKEFLDHSGADYAIAVNSCTAALHLAVLSAGIGPGDEVITTPMTFCATVNAIIHAGATPVLADIDPLTLNIDPDRVAEKITARTRAILPVHYTGRPCDMDRLAALCHRYGLRLIEDCAHAVETEYRGRKAGTFGDFGCFSFYATKSVVTGEGGMLLVKDSSEARRARFLSLHGLNRDAWKRYSASGWRHYQVTEAGFKYNMMDLQAAIGVHQLRRVEANWLRRQQIWHRYNEAFADLPVSLPAPPEPGTRHAYHLYTLLLDRERTGGLDRDQFLARMLAEQIGVGVHYLCLAEHPYYREVLGWQPEDYPVATSVGRRTASLPLSVKLSESDIERVIQTVRRCVLEAWPALSA